MADQAAIVAELVRRRSTLAPDKVAIVDELAKRFNIVEDIVRTTASDFGVDPDLAVRVARQESGFNQSAKSPKGAIGVMQLMPGTAQDLGVNPNDLHENIRGGMQYLRAQLDRFEGDVPKALAAYNAGPEVVAEGRPLPKETQDYIRAITASAPKQAPAAPDYDALARKYGAVSSVEPVPGMEALGGVPPGPPKLPDVVQPITAGAQIRAMQGPQGQRKAETFMRDKNATPGAWTVEDLEQDLMMTGITGALPKLMYAARSSPAAAKALMAANNALGLYFGAEMVKGGGEMAQKGLEAMRQGDYLGAFRYGGTAALSTVLGALGLRESVRHGVVFDPRYRQFQETLPPSQRDPGMRVEPKVEVLPPDPKMNGTGALPPARPPIDVTPEVEVTPTPAPEPTPEAPAPPQPAPPPAADLVPVVAPRPAMPAPAAPRPAAPVSMPPAAPAMPRAPQMPAVDYDALAARYGAVSSVVPEVEAPVEPTGKESLTVAPPVEAPVAPEPEPASTPAPVRIPLDQLQQNLEWATRAADALHAKDPSYPAASDSPDVQHIAAMVERERLRSSELAGTVAPVFDRAEQGYIDTLAANEQSLRDALKAEGIPEDAPAPLAATEPPVVAPQAPPPPLRQEVIPQTPAVAAEGAGKEPWEMTREEYVSQYTPGDGGPQLYHRDASGETKPITYREALDRKLITKEQYDHRFGGLNEKQAIRMNGTAAHHNAVYRALIEGKTVPQEVLAQYPDLVEKVGKWPHIPNAGRKPPEAAPLPAASESITTIPDVMRKTTPREDADFQVPSAEVMAQLEANATDKNHSRKGPYNRTAEDEGYDGWIKLTVKGQEYIAHHKSFRRAEVGRFGRLGDDIPGYFDVYTADETRAGKLYGNPLIRLRDDQILKPVITERVSPDLAPKTPQQPAAPPEKGGGIAGKEEAPKYDYSSTQVNLPESIAKQFQREANAIPDEKLAPEVGSGYGGGSAADGRESQPHITVKYGLHGEDPAEVEKLLAGEGPIKVRFGKASLFQNDDADVLKVDIESEDLHRLNKKIADALPNSDTHPEYKPHATIAYLKPGEGKAYAGKLVRGITGQSITLDRIVFSGKDGKQVEIELKTQPSGPFKQEYIDRFNRFTHYPKDLTKENADFVAESQRIRQDATERLEKYGFKEMPEDVADAIAQLEKARYEMALASAKAREVAPPWSVVGRSKYKGNPKRANAIESKALEAYEAAKHELDVRIRQHGPSGIVSSDAPDAVEQLQKKIADAERLQEVFKQGNSIIRKKDLTDEQKVQELVALGLKEKTAREALKPDFAGRVGFPDYALKNNSANIRRMKERIEQLTKSKAETTSETAFSGGRIVDSVEDNRLQIFFDGKPDESVRESLKKAGFKWAPSVEAWQRMRGRGAEWAVEKVLNVKVRGEAPAPTEVEPQAPEPQPVAPAPASEPESITPTVQAEPTEPTDFAEVETKLTTSEADLVSARKDYDRLKNLHSLASRRDLTPADLDTLDGSEFAKIKPSEQEETILKHVILAARKYEAQRQAHDKALAEAAEKNPLLQMQPDIAVPSVEIPVDEAANSNLRASTDNVHDKMSEILEYEKLYQEEYIKDSLPDLQRDLKDLQADIKDLEQASPDIMETARKVEAEAQKLIERMGAPGYAPPLAELPDSPNPRTITAWLNEHRVSTIDKNDQIATYGNHAVYPLNDGRLVWVSNTFGSNNDIIRQRLVAVSPTSEDLEPDFSGKESVREKLEDAIEYGELKPEARDRIMKMFDRPEPAKAAPPPPPPPKPEPPKPAAVEKPKQEAAPAEPEPEPEKPTGALAEVAMRRPVEPTMDDVEAESKTGLTRAQQQGMTYDGGYRVYSDLRPHHEGKNILEVFDPYEWKWLPAGEFSGSVYGRYSGYGYSGRHDLLSSKVDEKLIEKYPNIKPGPLTQDYLNEATKRFNADASSVTVPIPKSVKAAMERMDKAFSERPLWTYRTGQIKDAAEQLKVWRRAYERSKEWDDLFTARLSTIYHHAQDRGSRYGSGIEAERQEHAKLQALADRYPESATMEDVKKAAETDLGTDESLTAYKDGWRVVKYGYKGTQPKFTLQKFDPKTWTWDSDYSARSVAKTKAMDEFKESAASEPLTEATLQEQVASVRSDLDRWGKKKRTPEEITAAEREQALPDTEPDMSKPFTYEVKGDSIRYYLNFPNGEKWGPSSWQANVHGRDQIIDTWEGPRLDEEKAKSHAIARWWDASLDELRKKRVYSGEAYTNKVREMQDAAATMLAPAGRPRIIATRKDGDFTREYVVLPTIRSNEHVGYEVKYKDQNGGWASDHYNYNADGNTYDHAIETWLEKEAADVSQYEFRDPVAKEVAADLDKTNRLKMDMATVKPKEPERTGEFDELPAKASVTLSNHTVKNIVPVLKRIVPRRGTIPILQNVAIVTQKGKTKVIATDLETAVTYTLSGVSSEDSAVTLPLSAIENALKVKSKDPLKIETDGGKATLSIGVSESGTDTLGIGSYPELPKPAEKAGTMPASGFLEAIRSVVPSISAEESRFTLNGALVELKPGKATLVATDGHRLSVHEFDAPGITAEQPPLLINRNALETITKVFAKDQGDVQIKFDKDEAGKVVHIAVESSDGGVQVLARKLTGNFPDYHRVIPDNSSFTHRAVVTRKDLLNLMQQALAIKDRANAVALSFRDGQIATYRHVDEQTAKGKAPATLERMGESGGEPGNPRIGMNASYMADMLKSTDADKVEILLKEAPKGKEAAGAIVMRPVGGQNASTVIMPMRDANVDFDDGLPPYEPPKEAPEPEPEKPAIESAAPVEVKPPAIGDQIEFDSKREPGKIGRGKITGILKDGRIEVVMDPHTTGTRVAGPEIIHLDQIRK